MPEVGEPGNNGSLGSKKGYCLIWVPTFLLASLACPPKSSWGSLLGSAFLLFIPWLVREVTEVFWYILQFLPCEIESINSAGISEELWFCFLCTWDAAVVKIWRSFGILTYVCQKSFKTSQCCHGIWAFQSSLMVFIDIITTLQLKELLYPWAFRHLQKKLSVAEPEGKPTEKYYQMHNLYCLFQCRSIGIVKILFCFNLNSYWPPPQKDPFWIRLKIWTPMLLKESPVEDQLLLCWRAGGRLGQQPLLGERSDGLGTWIKWLTMKNYFTTNLNGFLSLLQSSVSTN